MMTLLKQERHERGSNLPQRHHMKIAILDTSIADTNLGNQIIMDAVVKELRDIFPRAFFYHVPVIEHVRAGRRFIEDADYAIIGGTNLLASDIRHTGDWRLPLRDVLWLRKLVLMGVGWWQYQAQPMSRYTRWVLRRGLDQNKVHAVREQYAVDKLADIGLRAVNTGCPSIWRLTEDHCRQVPTAPSDQVVLTFTDYYQNLESDQALLEIARKHYRKLYLWPQGYGDLAYVKTLKADDIEVIDPHLACYDQLLQSQQIDYLGTRLHAGIRALQTGRRSLIVAVDNRAKEMGGDFNLPVIARDDIHTNLAARLKTDWPTQVQPDLQAIQSWRDQFTDSTGD
jgi:polysaccharide pyruvyl transferase WcaK-like protein